MWSHFLWRMRWVGVSSEWIYFNVCVNLRSKIAFILIDGFGYTFSNSYGSSSENTPFNKSNYNLFFGWGISIGFDFNFGITTRFGIWFVWICWSLNSFWKCYWSSSPLSLEWTRAFIFCIDLCWTGLIKGIYFDKNGLGYSCGSASLEKMVVNPETSELKSSPKLLPLLFEISSTLGESLIVWV